ncbi:MAG: electron transfer flavoprotein subunit alpha/FixB family protein [Victivallales bacterium]|nr:electron transfer flavoprotein subunit alpha/FixB family protein [Victivallales bacterium]
MAYIHIHQELVQDAEALAALCPFHAIELHDGKLSIGAGCRFCRLCIRKGNGVFEFVEDDGNGPILDKSAWRGIAVVAEVSDGRIHPVTFELLGKARELARKVAYPVYCVLGGENVAPLTQDILEYGVDEVFLYEAPELRHFRVEPYTAMVEDFIHAVHPSVVLVGGTVTGRSLAPRTAARFRTGLTADCTLLDIAENTDLDQIRPAYGGNIMAHIRTPKHRPQFATVRYKIFSIPPKSAAHGKVTRRTLSPEALVTAIEILSVTPKTRESGIEEAEVIVAGGRGLKKPEDLSMLEELASLLNGRVASTRALVEAGWTDPKQQIGLSGRTVKPKLLIACGISGAIQFVAGMNGSEQIIAINTDPNAPIFKVAHVAITGDLYQMIPRLIEAIKHRKDMQ